MSRIFSVNPKIIYTGKFAIKMTWSKNAKYLRENEIGSKSGSSIPDYRIIMLCLEYFLRIVLMN
jgi:hypothetical protein